MSPPILAPKPLPIRWNAKWNLKPLDGERHQPNYPYPSPGGLGRYPCGGYSPPPGGYSPRRLVEPMGVAYKTTYEEEAIQAATEQHENLVGPNRYGVQSEYHTQTHEFSPTPPKKSIWNRLKVWKRRSKLKVGEGPIPLKTCIKKPGTAETGDIHLHPNTCHAYHHETNRLISSSTSNPPNQYGEPVANGFCLGSSDSCEMKFSGVPRVHSHVHVYDHALMESLILHDTQGGMALFFPGRPDLDAAERFEKSISNFFFNQGEGMNGPTFIVGVPGAPLKTPTPDGKTHAPMDWRRYDPFTRSCVLLLDKPESLRGKTPPPHRGFNMPDVAKVPTLPPFPPGPSEFNNPFGVSYLPGPQFDANRKW